MWKREAASGPVRTGGVLVAEALRAHGVRRVYGVPGESYLPLLDAFYDLGDEIAYVACRHEHGAAMMAEADAKLTGGPGVCVVTRGPGACNAAIGVHTAFQDSTPMLLLAGQVERAFLGREAFQEVDLVAMFSPLAKRALQVSRAADLPAVIAEALWVARSDRPGPVVVALPEDVLAETAAVPDAPPRPLHPSHPDPGLMERLHRVLGDAHRPLLLVGGGGWSAAARADLVAFAEANRLPVVCGFRRNDLFDNDHPSYAGELGIGANPALVARVRAADLLLAVGSRLGEATTQGYALPGGAAPELVHVHPDAAELGRVFAPAIGIAAGAGEFLAAARHLTPTCSRHRADWAEAARADYLADTEPQPRRSAFDPAAAMAQLRSLLPEDAIVTVDAGNFSGWPQRYLCFGGQRRLLGPCNGAMGYGVPAAIAAKLAHPGRMVVACTGDGGFGMTGSELATAMRERVAPIVLVFDNAMYGTIRMHQERSFPSRVIGTGLASPDFAALAVAYGAWAERVERTEAFAPAFERAAEVTAGGRPALLHLCLDADDVSTRTTLSALCARSARSGDQR